MYRFCALITAVLSVASNAWAVESTSGDIHFQNGRLISDKEISKLDIDQPYCKINELELQALVGDSGQVATELPNTFSSNSKTHKTNETRFWMESGVEFLCSSPFRLLSYTDIPRIVGKNIPIDRDHKPTEVNQQPVEVAANLLGQFNRSPAVNPQAASSTQLRRDRKAGDVKIIEIDLAAPKAGVATTTDL